MPTRSTAAINKSNPQAQRASFWATAGEAVVASDIVAYDIAASGDARYTTVILADSDETSVGTAIVAGVALNAAASGEPVEICYWGICDVHITATDVAAGDRLMLSATAGRVQPAAIAGEGGGYSEAELLAALKLPIVGIAIEADTTDNSTGCAAFVRVGPGPF